jgi:cytoplasmic iron level regulating protein YaaA (DUF328/UPF0246 family)
MLVVISPAKSLDFQSPLQIKKYTLPEMLGQSEKLMGRLKKLNPKQISAFMNISDDLGELNFQRFQNWNLPFTSENARQAVLAFSGDVYQGLQAATLPPEKMELAQTRLRILSGLYGVLKPLDLIQPYRLEMATKLTYLKSKDLYEFWKPSITRKIDEALNESGSRVLVNLASIEYFKSIDYKKLNTTIVSPEFKDFKNGTYKIISFYAKRARGLMTRFILENNITDITSLYAFDSEGYVFNPHLSKPGTPVFTRDK